MQTNEIRRCSYLAPAFTVASEQAAHRPLALIEVGTSAGLNLLWDRYGYRYRGRDGRSIVAGAVGSPAQIECELRGEIALPGSDIQAEVFSRTGIDLRPLDLRDRTDLLWLQALIWPEHVERRELLEAAATIYERHPPSLVAGDAVEVLPGVLDRIDAEVVPVIFHTHTLNQFSQEMRIRLEGIIAESAARRDGPVFRIGNDLGGGGPHHSTLKLRCYEPNKCDERMLANVDGHGRWMEWLAQ